MATPPWDCLRCFYGVCSTHQPPDGPEPEDDYEALGYPETEFAETSLDNASELVKVSLVWIGVIAALYEPQKEEAYGNESK